MPTTLAAVIAELRYELKDTDAAAYRWTDAELTRHLRRALVEYSRASPRHMKTTKATTASSRAIDISAMTGYDDIIKLLAVEYPVGVFPQQYQRFQYWNGVITLVGDVVPDGSNAYIYWGGVHVLTDAGSPTCSIDEKDQETVITGAAAFAAYAWASYATNRVNVGSDATVKEFFGYAAEKRNAFQKELNRLRSVVRTQRMYPPNTPRQSQTTDWGP